MIVNKFLNTWQNNANSFAKRLFDIVFSLMVLIIGFPLYFFLILLIKMTSKGPVFYKGLRMGRYGRLINCWKFRTMILDADQKLEEILQNNCDLKKEWETYHKLKQDPRLTKVGAFLRKCSLDELPQFWNVLKGDLSVVGPRPIDIRNSEKAFEEIWSKYFQSTNKILSVRPGMISLWQLKGRNHLTIKERAAFEEEYVNRQSLFFDLKIICKAISILLFPKGAY